MFLFFFGGAALDCFLFYLLESKTLDEPRACTSHHAAFRSSLPEFLDFELFGKTMLVSVAQWRLPCFLRKGSSLTSTITNKDAFFIFMATGKETVPPFLAHPLRKRGSLLWGAVLTAMS